MKYMGFVTFTITLSLSILASAKTLSAQYKTQLGIKVLEAIETEKDEANKPLFDIRFLFPGTEKLHKAFTESEGNEFGRNFFSDLDCKPSKAKPSWDVCTFSDKKVVVELVDGLPNVVVPDPADPISELTDKK